MLLTPGNASNTNHQRENNGYTIVRCGGRDSGWSLESCVLGERRRYKLQCINICERVPSTT